MEKFLLYNWKTITLSILGVIFIYLLFRVFTPVKDRSELNKYKLEQIDKHLEEITNFQKDLNVLIQEYRIKIDKIDQKISNIKLEKTEVNNYYTQKNEEIKNSHNKQLDSLIKKRYNF